MTAKRRVALGKKARLAQMQDGLDRAAQKAAGRGRARDRAAWNAARLGGIEEQSLADAMARVLAEEDAAAPAPKALPAKAFPDAMVAEGRWVPIGPSVVRRGQANDNPRVTGRVRDIWVDETGTRAYAATAMGGVWYTEDGGSIWTPFGGWAERPRVVGGSSNARACGSLLVWFGGTAADDVVMVGTGEPTPLETETGYGALGGIGVLTLKHPVADVMTGDPWEPDSGLAELEGFGTYRLVRSPASKPGSASGADQDKVVACTTQGAFLGTRKSLPASGGLPVRDGFEWARMPTVPNVAVSDAVWLSGGRLVMALVGTGLVYTDDLGVTVVPIAATQQPAIQITDRMSLALVAGTNRVYLLGQTAGVPTLWVIPDAMNPPIPPALLVDLPSLPAGLWNAGQSQQNYDQAIAVDVVAAKDRVYVGGSTVSVLAAWAASLYCYEVVAGALQAVPTVSGVAAPPAGAGANVPGLIGNNVHADVHVIRLTGKAPAPRQAWVGTDGGVFVSDRAGRVHTFASMSNGMGSLQAVFIRNHPVSGHLVAAGYQDNGTQVRTGDTVWDERFQSDGGGVAFVPTAPHLLIRQYLNARWYCTSSTAFVDPISRSPGTPNVPALDPESRASAAYSGVATIVVGPNRSRVAIGTDRVWLSEDLGVALPNTWLTLPYPPGVLLKDGRLGPPPGSPTPAQRAMGVPTPAIGAVLALSWVKPTELLALYQQGIVRYTEAPPGTWTTKTWRLTDASVAISRHTTPTDICAIPDVRNFYVSTIGEPGKIEETLWFYSPTGDTFQRTKLRHVLDKVGPPLVVGPRDPAFAVALDPADPKVVFVGTATGVWRGERKTPQGDHEWHSYVNGLPQSVVQDLQTWRDPAGGSLRLLRAGLQSRGVWEVDLSAKAQRATWIRSSAHDNRRLPLAPAPDPLATPPPPPPPPPHVLVSSSPDIVVRPESPVIFPPAFLGAPAITKGGATPYQVWTFQTAFRWLYPSVVADGQWSDAFDNLLMHHRTTMGKTAVAEIDADVWANVVGTMAGGLVTGGVRVKADGKVTTAPADPLAVYRAPWQTPRAPKAPPSEVDFLDLVVPARPGPPWEVYKELSVVDVLTHHRDGRPTDGAYAALLWRSGATAADLMALPALPVLTYLTSVAGSGALAAAPAGWTVALSGANARWTVPVPVDGRLPRGATIPVDLRAAGPHVLLLAFVCSTDDDAVPAPSTSAIASVMPLSITELVTCWPYAAARVVSVSVRPR
ncbi:hypothetical protein ACPPVT_12560 [Angustibacter sp. McL0619]|uniref:hypothetical protein n=1 Tax=Angustibacter sp. McL0619 TaxID=3415676 RepID=UPI003CF5A169